MTSSSLTGCLEPGGRSLVDTITPPSALSCPVYESRVLRSPRHELTPVPGIGGVYSGTYPKSQGYYSTCSSDVTAALYSRVSFRLS